MDGLTIHEAQTVELPIRPFARVARIAEYAGEYGLKKVGMSPLPIALTRRGLVRLAAINEDTRRTIQIADNIRLGEE